MKFCLAKNDCSFVDPQRYYGSGTYALTKVMNISGTEGYIDLAQPGKRGLCQNVKPFQDCLMEDYMERGLEVCKCVPLYLRNLKKQVRYQKSKSQSSHLAFIG